jgi:hypothetical protein
MFFDHPLALRSKIRSGRNLLAATRRSDRSEKQILRDHSHFER